MMLPDMPRYQATSKNVWQGRQDSLPGERFFQRVQCVDARTHTFDKKPQTAFIGFCSDEGIRRNGGRVGAKEGPDELRKQLAKLACHVDQQYLDLGNIQCTDGQLEAAQLELSTLISHCHESQLKTVVFGGGHDVAWGHFMGLMPRYPNMGIINFDAHFDLRQPLDGQLGTSGTPFWQIKQHCLQHNTPFDYCCMGIQSMANSRQLFKRAHEWDVSYLSAEQIIHEPFARKTAFLDDFISRHDHLYLSICLDVFAESVAPGVSAPQALGLNPWHAIPLLKYIAQSGKVVSMDIVELSPPLDHEQKTSRLAAAIIAELLNLKEYTHE